MKRIVMILSVLLLTACDTTVDLISCEGNQEVAGICVDVTPPVVQGANNITLYQYESFSPLSGITAIDDTSGDLTEQITVNGNVNTNELGLYLVTYSVMDEFTNEAIVLRYINVIPDPANFGGNIVQNGDFSDGFNGFTTYMAENGSGTFTVVNDILKVDVDSVTASIPWEPRLEYQQLRFTEGTTYHVSFDIVANHERQFEVYIGELIPYDPWFISYSASHQTRLVASTTWTTYEFDFTMSAETTYNGCILFHFGAVGTSQNMLTTLYVDNVVIQPLN